MWPFRRTQSTVETWQLVALWGTFLVFSADLVRKIVPIVDFKDLPVARSPVHQVLRRHLSHYSHGLPATGLEDARDHGGSNAFTCGVRIPRELLPASEDIIWEIVGHVAVSIRYRTVYPLLLGVDYLPTLCFHLSPQRIKTVQLTATTYIQGSVQWLYYCPCILSVCIVPLQVGQRTVDHLLSLYVLHKTRMVMTDESKRRSTPVPGALIYHYPPIRKANQVNT